MSEINDTEEVSEGIFPTNLKSIYQYQRKYPSLFAKYKEGVYLNGGIEDNTVILSIIQSYVLHWYHKYLLHPRMDITEATSLIYDSRMMFIYL